MSNFENDIRDTEERIQNHLVHGMLFVRNREGRPYASDNDVALWTGVHLAQKSFAYAVDGSYERLEDVRDAMDGVDRLLNGLGSGVLSRWAFPTFGAWDLIGYHPDQSLASPGNTFGDRIRAGNVYHRSRFVFETRTTRDQLSGILYGLSACATLVPGEFMNVKRCVRALYGRMLATDWSLRDHTGSTGGTSAHRVDSAQRLVIRALMRYVDPGFEKPSSLWFRFIPLVTLHYNRRWQAAYSHLLNSLDAHSLLMLDEYHYEGRGVRKWWDRIWKQMKGDASPHFAAIDGAFRGRGFDVREAANLWKLVEHPYSGSYQWNREVEDRWPTGKPTIGGGLDLLHPYWLDEYRRTGQ